MGAYGASVAITSDIDGLASQVAAALVRRTQLAAEPTATPSAWCELHGTTDGVVATFRHGDELIRTLPPAPTHAKAIDYVVGSIHHLVAVASSGMCFVHAANVEVAGRHLLLPGRSRAGKSTLVRSLVALGARCWSDEFAVIDDQGLLLPYHKPISERDGGVRPQLIDVDPVPADLVPSAGSCVILRTEYSADQRGEWLPMTASQMSFALLDNCLTARQDPVLALDAIAELVKRSKGYEGERGEADDAAARALVLLARP